MLAHEVLDSLLLRIGIEINKGPLATVLNMALFPILKKRDSITCDLPSFDRFLHGHWPGT